MFIAETMPEAEKEKLPFKVFTDHQGDKPTLSRWAVDRERDAYIVQINKHGGPYEGTPEEWRLVLNWQGHLIYITAEKKDVTFPESGGSVMHWWVHKLEIPESLQEREDEPIAMVREAFKGVDQFFNGERFTDVEVEIRLTEYPTFKPI